MQGAITNLEFWLELGIKYMCVYGKELIDGSINCKIKYQQVLPNIR